MGIAITRLRLAYQREYRVLRDLQCVGIPAYRQEWIVNRIRAKLAQLEGK